MIVTQREREREAETQAEGEAGSMHQKPDVGFDPGPPESRPGPKAGTKPLRHPGIPLSFSFYSLFPSFFLYSFSFFSFFPSFSPLFFSFSQYNFFLATLHSGK